MPYTKKQVRFFNSSTGREKVPASVRQEANAMAARGETKPAVRKSPKRKK